MLIFTEDDVRRILTMPDAIACMRRAFTALASGEAQDQPRRRLVLKTGSVLHSMAGSFDRYFGTKIYSTGSHGAHFTFLLYDAATAQPLAQFEANYLGQIRTGAVSGLVTDLLAPADSHTLGIIGSGFQARSQLAAVLAVRKPSAVRVWSRDPDKSRKFARDAQAEFVIDVQPAASVTEAADVDILITATSSRTPVLPAGWRPSRPVLINAMGSNWSDRRELPAALVQSAGLLIVDDIAQAKIEAGDFTQALSENDWNRVASVSDLLAKPDMLTKRDAQGTTIFKSVGLGLEDVAVAAFVYESAIPGR